MNSLNITKIFKQVQLSNFRNVHRPCRLSDLLEVSTTDLQPNQTQTYQCNRLKSSLAEEE